MATFALRVLLLALATTAIMIIAASQADSASWEEKTAAQEFPHPQSRSVQTDYGIESSDEESADFNHMSDDSDEESADSGIEALRKVDASKLKDIQITVDSKRLPALMQDVQRGKKIKIVIEVVDDDYNELRK